MAFLEVLAVIVVMELIVYSSRDEKKREVSMTEAVIGMSVLALAFIFFVIF